MRGLARKGYGCVVSVVVMRLVPILAAAFLLAGCQGPPPSPQDAPSAAADLPAPMELGRGSFQSGAPQAGPLQGGAFLGLQVPANLTHLTVQLTITVGGSVGLRTTGVPGCDHRYPDPQVMGDPLVYDCEAEPGRHDLTFAHSGGRVHFDVVVTAAPAEA